MEPDDQTAETLRVLVQDLGDKLPPSKRVPHIDELESLAASGVGINGLVTDLDAKLAGRTSGRPGDDLDAIRATTRHYTRGLPIWLVSLAVAFLLLGLGTAIVQPWNQGCSFAGDLCSIADLDVDLMQTRIPDSELAATLPQLEVLDPDNVFTFGDVFASEGYADVDFEELITAADIERLLGASS